MGELFRINDIKLEGEISLDLSEENPDSIIQLLSKFHEVTIDIGAKMLEDALLTKGSRLEKLVRICIPAMVE